LGNDDRNVSSLQIGNISKKKKKKKQGNRAVKSLLLVSTYIYQLYLE